MGALGHGLYQPPAGPSCSDLVTLVDARRFAVNRDGGMVEIRMSGC
jgi:hypothetical protein